MIMALTRETRDFYSRLCRYAKRRYLQTVPCRITPEFDTAKNKPTYNFFTGMALS
jgi:hypothetical protein